MDEKRKAELLKACEDAAEALVVAREAHDLAMAARRKALVEADDAGVDRELIADACGLQWPLSRNRWSQLRRGVSR